MRQTCGQLTGRERQPITARGAEASFMTFRAGFKLETVFGVSSAPGFREVAFSCAAAMSSSRAARIAENDLLISLVRAEANIWDQKTTAYRFRLPCNCKRPRCIKLRATSLRSVGNAVFFFLRVVSEGFLYRGCFGGFIKVHVKRTTT